MANNINICDLEWFNGDHSIANIQCMQLSTYYKQRGYDVTLITCKEEFSYNCEMLFVFREKESTPIPRCIRVNGDKNKIKLVGYGFRKYTNYVKLNELIICMRPDYLLYPEIKGKYSNANYVQFFYKDILVKYRQDYHNTLSNKKFTIVMDKQFWSQHEEAILWCLGELKKEKNVVFRHPISLKVLLTNTKIKDAFMQLHFMRGTEFKWRNDYSSSATEPIIALLEELRRNTKSKLGYIPIKARLDGEDNEVSWYRCFCVMKQFKQHKLYCRIITNNEPHTIYKQFEYWSRYLPKLSFIEAVLHTIVLSSGLDCTTIINDAKNWRNRKIDWLLNLMTNEQYHNNQLLTIQWGDKYYNDKEVNYNYIKKNISLLYRREDE